MNPKRSRTPGTDGKSLHIDRRAFLSNLVALPLAVSLSRINTFTLVQDAGTTEFPFRRLYDFTSLKQWITSNADFFVRSHFDVPSPTTFPWTIKVTGAVHRELVITLNQLMKLPVVEQVVTLECAGNPVGWGGVSNARWMGVSLRALLDSAGVKRGAIEVILVGADGGIDAGKARTPVDAYARSIPLEKALDRHTILAWKMNREPLPLIHGAPLRAIVPGWYGMDSVKWLKQIVVSTESFQGFYQTNRYNEERLTDGVLKRSQLAAIRVKSQIARPLMGELLSRGGAIAVVGAAWSGAAEIVRVEVSTNGGRTWEKALLGQERSSFAWRLWSYEWRPPVPGEYEILVCAQDAKGNKQPSRRDSSVFSPYAYNWFDRRVVQVR